MPVPVPVLVPVLVLVLGFVTLAHCPASSLALAAPAPEMVATEAVA